MKQRIRNLDTFRAIAAIVVMIGHIELFREQSFHCSFFSFLPNGHIGVILFFVISGFLISYLMQTEQNTYGSIHIKDFYLRRIFRIWPLYYLVLLISYAFFIDAPSGKTIAYAATILPNISHVIGCGWSVSPQIWSIGVENLFYLFFPLVMTIVPKNKLPFALFLFIVAYAVLPHCIDYTNARTLKSSELFTLNNKFFYCNKFDVLAIGCLVGHLYAQKHDWLKYLHNKYLFIGCALIAIICWSCNIYTKHFSEELMAVLFAIIILNVCTNEKLQIKFENSVPNFLGKISYGIYMYHWIVLLLAFKILPLSNNLGSTLLLYVFVFTTTICIAWLSFETYEKFFLNIKKRFER